MADEHMSDDELVEPPRVAGGEGPGAAESPPAAADTAPAGRVTAAGPSPPAKRGRTARTQAGWNGTDMLVLLLALAVIAASLLGLSWLFGSP